MPILSTVDRKTLWLGLALALAVAVVYLPVRHHGFIRFDDPAYVQENPRVLGGFTAESVVWAFTTGHSSNWHPMTWLSHMADVELFGKAPQGHHLTSVAFHAANSFLLLLFLAGVTGARGPSLLVATFFAFHPLRVESVAWISERKDVLSMFFFLLMLLAYARYVKTRPEAALGPTSYTASPGSSPQIRAVSFGCALLLFALGLMSKPMLVTVPFLLLVLDVWPFERLKPPGTWGQWRPLLLEKIPFLALSVASSCVTFLVQQKAHAVTLALPIGSRLENVIASYCKYIGKTLYPVDLAVFYPHPDTRYPLSEQWPLWMISAAALGLASLTLVAFWSIRRAPAFATGWFWFLGTLVPVIGIVQVGGQAMADRYTYLPHVGLLIAIIWPLWTFLSRRPEVFRKLGILLAVVASASCVFLTHAQIPLWRDTETLFTHALKVTRNNAVAHVQLGSQFGERGEFQRAIEHFQQAIEAAPASADGYLGLGFTYELQNRPELALEQYQLALQLRPWDPVVQTRIGDVLNRSGRVFEAMERWHEAIRLDGDAFEPRLRLAIALSRQGHAQEAELNFRKALALDSANKEAIGNFAEHWLRLGRAADAEQWFRRLVQLEPNNPDFLVNLGGMAWRRGAKTEAFELYQRATAADPGHPLAHQNAGMAAYDLKRFAEAERSFRRAAELNRASTFPLLGLSRALLQQGRAQEAVQHARQAVTIQGDNLECLSMLDIALAANGDFEEAVRWATRARDVANAKGETEAAHAAQQRIQLYEKKQAFKLP